MRLDPSRPATYARIRAALCEESPIDLEEHAKLIAEAVVRSRRHARIAQASKLNELATRHAAAVEEFLSALADRRYSR